MNALMILYAVIVVIVLFFVCIGLQSLRRWWVKPYANPAKLYRQLRRLKRISRADHREILNKSLVAPPEGNQRKPQIDWQKACRSLFNV